MKNKFLTASENMSPEYCCTVVRLGEIQEIPGAKTVAKTLVNGRTIVIGKNQKEGDVMIYVSNESELNRDFLSVNNMFQNVEFNANAIEVQTWLEENKDISEDEKKEYLQQHRGYFDDKGRVRMKKLAGEVSMGILLSVDSLKTWCPMLDVDFNSLVGLDFDTLNGELMVKAYVPKVKQRPERASKDGRRNKKLLKYDRLIPGQFSFHYDTNLFEKNVHRFKPEDVVTVSNKIHGCVERNTIVETAEYGKLEIGKIVDEKINCNIKAYDTILKEDVFVPIDDFYLLKNDGEWYEIELEDGRKITITGNNPVWLPVLNSYRRVDELIGNEYLQVDE